MLVQNERGKGGHRSIWHATKRVKPCALDSADSKWPWKMVLVRQTRWIMMNVRMNCWASIGRTCSNSAAKWAALAGGLTGLSNNPRSIIFILKTSSWTQPNNNTYIKGIISRTLLWTHFWFGCVVLSSKFAFFSLSTFVFCFCFASVSRDQPFLVAYEHQPPSLIGRWSSCLRGLLRWLSSKLLTSRWLID